MLSGIRPDITAAQAVSILAVAAAVILSHAGWMTTDQFFGVCATAGALKLSDAGVRAARNVADAALHNSVAAQVRVMPDGDDSKVA